MGRPHHEDPYITQLKAMNVTLSAIAASVKKLADANDAVGVKVVVDPPTERKTVMALKFFKKSDLAKKRLSLVKAVPGAVVETGILDNEDQTFTYVGVNAAGNPVDISAVAKVTDGPTSDNPPVVTVDPPTGVTSALHAVGPLGKANITGIITWNDGHIGPFTVVLGATVSANPNATGVVVVVGPPTTH